MLLSSSFHTRLHVSVKLLLHLNELPIRYGLIQDGALRWPGLMIILGYTLFTITGQLLASLDIGLQCLQGAAAT